MHTDGNTHTHTDRHCKHKLTILRLYFPGNVVIFDEYLFKLYNNNNNPAGDMEAYMTIGGQNKKRYYPEFSIYFL